MHALQQRQKLSHSEFPWLVMVSVCTTIEGLDRTAGQRRAVRQARDRPA